MGFTSGGVCGPTDCVLSTSMATPFACKREMTHRKREMLKYRKRQMTYRKRQKTYLPTVAVRKLESVQGVGGHVPKFRVFVREGAVRFLKYLIGYD